MEKLSNLEKLRLIKSRGIEIYWKKFDNKIPMATGAYSTGFCIPYSPPTLPSKLILYTNQNIENLEYKINSCIREIKEYDTYLGSMEDNPEVLDLKQTFEKE